MKWRFLLVAAGVVAAGIAWFLLSPLFIDDVVEEELPEVFSSMEEFDRILAMPSEDEIKLMNDEEMEKLAGDMNEKAAKMPDVVVDEEMIEPKDTPVQREVPEVKGPLLIASGDFRDGDSFHKGSGKVKVFQSGDGTKLLRLEDFEVTNGPDLFIYLTEKGNVQSSSDVKEGFYDLARLKGNKGNQNYVLPNEVNLDDYQGVAIYCRAFSTLFSAADL